MKNNEHVQSKIEEALNSLDETKRTMPQPFLLTRIMARMNTSKETAWEKTGRLISRPSFAIAGLSTLFVLNVLVIKLNHHSANNSEQTTFVTSGDFPSANITINDIENTEP